MAAFSFKPVNSMRAKQTTWSREHGGLIYTVTLQGLLKHLQDAEIKTVELKEIKHLSTVARVSEDQLSEETKQRVERVDLEEPIILLAGSSGDCQMIVDGHHRVSRALREGRRELPALYLDLQNAPFAFQVVFG